MRPRRERLFLGAARVDRVVGAVRRQDRQRRAMVVVARRTVVVGRRHDAVHLDAGAAAAARL